MVDVPNVAGIPFAHVYDDAALPGVPVVYRSPGVFWNTHESHTVCPEVTGTGLVNCTVCHPAEVLTTVEAVIPNLEAGDPLWLE
jgi:hypothetical protein